MIGSPKFAHDFPLLMSLSSHESMQRTSEILLAYYNFFLFCFIRPENQMTHTLKWNYRNI